MNCFKLPRMKTALRVLMSGAVRKMRARKNDPVPERIRKTESGKENIRLKTGTMMIRVKVAQTM